MNILYFSPGNTIGGAELSLLGIIKEANNHGHNFYVALPPIKRGDTTYMEMLKPLCEAVYIVRPMSWHIPRGLNWKQRIINYLYHIYLSGWHIVPVFKLLRIIRHHNIDIVHTNTIMNIEPALAAKLTGVPHVWHIREGIGYNPNAIVQFPLQKNPQLFRWIMNKLSSKIIANSKFTKSLAKQYFPEDKIDVIYNSLPDEWFVHKVYQADKTKIVIGTVANVTATLKNHALVIEVAEILRNKYSNINVVFNIYGNLPPDDNPYYSNLVEEINNYDLSGNVHFMGIRNVNEIYDTIDILFHPNGKEGFGRIFIEAMGKGIPVLAVKGGGADELIEDGVTGYKFSDDEPEHIANKIIELITNQETYNKISQKGFEYASTDFKSSGMWKKIENIYCSVVR